MKVVEMAVELLEAMDESVVAKNAAQLLKQNLSVLKSATVRVDANTAAVIPFENLPLDTLVSPYMEHGIGDEVYYLLIYLCICKGDFLTECIGHLPRTRSSRIRFLTGHDTFLWRGERDYTSGHQYFQ